MTRHAHRRLSQQVDKRFYGRLYRQDDEPVAGQLDDHLYRRLGDQLYRPIDRQVYRQLRQHLDERADR